MHNLHQSWYAGANRPPIWTEDQGFFGIGVATWTTHRVEMLPGITAIGATGHSPGHHLYAIQSRGQTLIDIGDLSHHQILLLKRPHWEFQFDYDSVKAAETRIRHFDRIVQERHAILAYHFPFPGLGHLRKDRDGYT
jgi:glyoxylase-like metal-dependent hydrolase (beta-lactamase superfamily II)